jgi:hypothetical protein
VYPTANFAPVLPTLFDDIQRRMDSWGKQGTMDPFKNVYDVSHIFSLPSFDPERIQHTFYSLFSK